MKNIFNSKVFIVDDDMFKCLIYKKHLVNLGFTDITVFNSGVDCLDNLSENPEIILLDHQMDHISGFEILKKVKRFNPNAHVIMVSGQEDMNTTISSLKYGAFDYIIKGHDDLQKIKNALSRISVLKTRITATSTSFIKKIMPFL